MTLHYLACEQTITTGTASVVLSGAVEGCNTWEDAGVSNSETVHYAIVTYDLHTHRPTHREVGTGVYTTADNTCTRATVAASTNGGSKIVLTGLSDVSIMPLISDFSGGGGGGVDSSAYSNAGTANTLTNNTDDNQLTIDTEGTDAGTISSLSSDTITIANAGDYLVLVNVSISGVSAFNGRVNVTLNGPYNIVKQQGYTTAMGITDDFIYLEAYYYGIGSAEPLEVYVDNHLGESIDAYVNEVTIIQLG